MMKANTLPSLLTPKAAAAALGISLRSCRNLLTQGRLPFVLVGKRKRITEDTIARVLRDGLPTETSEDYRAYMADYQRTRRARMGKVSRSKRAIPAAEKLRRLRRTLASHLLLCETLKRKIAALEREAAE